MNKMLRLSRTGIEYLDYVWNFESGCTNGCSYCWARPITKRFQDRYPNGFAPTVYPEALLSPLWLLKPSIIGCAFMGDLFDDAINPNRMFNVSIVPGLSEAAPLRDRVFRTIEQTPQHRFLFLTKQPQNLEPWSPFPENCWVGVSATTFSMSALAMNYLGEIQAGVKYLSYEPLQKRMTWEAKGYTVDALARDFERFLGWVIIGAQTKPYKPPDIECVQEIVKAADAAGIPVFLKDNLRPLLPAFARHRWAYSKRWSYRQEMPR